MSTERENIKRHLLNRAEMLAQHVSDLVKSDEVRRAMSYSQCEKSIRLVEKYNGLKEELGRLPYEGRPFAKSIKAAIELLKTTHVCDAERLADECPVCEAKEKLLVALHEDGVEVTL